jgi:hypothetical protein
LTGLTRRRPFEILRAKAGQAGSTGLFLLKSFHHSGFWILTSDLWFSQHSILPGFLAQLRKIFAFEID